MKKSEVLKCVAILMAAYPNAQVNEATASAYAQFLGDLEAEFVMKAVEQLVRTSKWLPTIAEIREVALSFDLRRQTLAAGERPAPPPGCNGWRELRPARGDPEGPYVEGEATDGWWYRFEGKLPVRVRQARAQLEEGEK